MEARTLKKRGRPSFLDEIKNDILNDFNVANARIEKMFHLKTVYATKLMKEMDRIARENDKIRDARRKAYILDYEEKVIRNELKRLGVKK